MRLRQAGICSPTTKALLIEMHAISKTLVYETVEKHHQIDAKEDQISLKTSLKINVLLLTP